MSLHISTTTNISWLWQRPTPNVEYTVFNQNSAQHALDKSCQAENKEIWRFVEPFRVAQNSPVVAILAMWLHPESVKAYFSIFAMHSFKSDGLEFGEKLRGIFIQAEAFFSAKYGSPSEMV